MIVFGVVSFGTVNLLSFSVPGRHYRDRNRLGVRWPVNWQQRTPPPPNDWIQAVHLVSCLSDLGTIQRRFQSNRVRTDRDLLPIRAITDGDARHRTGAASA